MVHVAKQSPKRKKEEQILPSDDLRDTIDISYVCTKCSQTFSAIYELKKHQETHTEEKPINCRNSDKAILGASDMEEHEKTHKGDNKNQGGISIETNAEYELLLDLFLK